MGRRKLSAEEKHARQKAKLEAKGDIKVATYSPVPSVKDMALKKAEAAGFSCIMESSTLMFLYDTYDEKFYNKVKDWILKNFGVDNGPGKERGLPFSFGIKKKGKDTRSAVVSEIEENDEVTEDNGE